MKKLILTISLLLLSYLISAQCISGDCENGAGFFKYENLDSYEGYFQNGQIYNLGVYYVSNGTEIWGQIKNSKFNGFGIIYWENGYSYIGDLKQGLQDGLGIMYDTEKRPHSAGTWERGKLINPVNGDDTNNLENCIGNCENGYGKLTLSDKTIIQGIFNNAEPIFGTIQNGEYVYSGGIQNKLANGVGIIEYYNGKKHLGYFKDGKKQGAGIYKEGIILKTYGIWDNDVYIGKETYVFNEKHFCNGLANICDMTAKDLKLMEVQTADLLGNLWKYNFLNRFDIYYNQINASQEMLFIDFSNTQGVNAAVITGLLEKCSVIQKMNTSYELNAVEIKLLEEDNVLMLQLNFPKNE